MNLLNSKKHNSYTKKYVNEYCLQVLIKDLYKNNKVGSTSALLYKDLNLHRAPGNLTVA